MSNLAEQIQEATDLIATYGGIDGVHHKQWLIDQVLRTLLKEDYDSWVEEYECPAVLLIFCVY